MTRTGPAGRRATGELAGTDTRLGLISPLTANFCDGCNRVRLTTEGKLYACLGHDDQVDLKAALRDGGLPALDAAIDEALADQAARDTTSRSSAAPRRPWRAT